MGMQLCSLPQALGAGYVRHEPDPNDTRRQTLALTAKADEVLRRSSTIHQTEIRDMAPRQPVAESSIPKSGSAAYWRFTMVTKRKFESDAFEAIHTAVEGMYAAGTIDKETMRTFDEACLFRPARADPRRDQDAARKQSR